MRTIVALTIAELKMLMRNRTAAATAVLMPLGFGLFWVFGDPAMAFDAAGVVALQVLAVLAFTLYASGTMAIVARREGAVLKRWRASPAASPAILTGIVLPLGILLVLQVAILVSATAVAIEETPRHPGVLVVGLVVSIVCVGSLALATAALTRSSEGSMLTTTPIVGALIAGGMWVMATPSDEVTPLMLATGGGAVARLVHLGWEGQAGAWIGGMTMEALVALAALAVLGLAGALAAALTFRWDPRG